MDPFTFVIQASGGWAIGKSLDATLHGLAYIRRGICKDFVHLKHSDKAFLKLVGEIAEIGARESKDTEFQNAVIAKLNVSQGDLEKIWRELQESSAWQAEAAMDLRSLLQSQTRFRHDLSNILAQLKGMAQQTHGIDANSIDQIADHVANELKLEPIRARVDELHDILTGGLMSPLRAWTRYWDRMRSGIPWDHFSKPGNTDAAYRIVASFIGRESELAAFDAFLADPQSQIVHHYGEPGTGKSRLLHECAMRAEMQGWAVWFIDERAITTRLHSALSNIDKQIAAEGVTGILLIWDDWQGEADEDIKDFLKANADLGIAAGGLPIKRLVSSWPVFKQAIEQKWDHYAPFDARLISPMKPDDDATQSLLASIGLINEQARAIANAAGGHPMAMILGADLVLGGGELRDLDGRDKILHRSYEKLLGGLRPKDAQSDWPPEAYDLRQVALLGEITGTDIAKLGKIEGYPAPGDARGRFARLKSAYYLRRDAERAVYYVSNDLLRRHIVAQAVGAGLGEGAGFLPFKDTEQAMRYLAPYSTPHGLSTTYPVLASLTSPADPPDQIAKLERLRINFLRAGAERQLAAEPSVNGDLLFAELLLTLTAAENSPAMRLMIADQLQPIADRHVPPNAEIDLELAKVLYNATLVERDSEKCTMIADQIELIADRHNPPNTEIDIERARALHIATIVNQDADKRKTIADQIQPIADRHEPPNPEIDFHWAAALFSATLCQRDGDLQMSIADEIRTIADRHVPPSSLIDLEWAKVFSFLTHDEPVADKCMFIAAEIQPIADRHKPPNAEIDLEWTDAFVNATLAEPDAGKRKSLADQIQQIADRHEPPHAEIDLKWAEALIYAILAEPDVGKRKSLADQIQHIADRHEPPNAKIDLAWAEALFLATVGEPDTEKQIAIVGPPRPDGAFDEDPIAEIELVWARSLYSAIIVEPNSGYRRSIAAEIQPIAERNTGQEYESQMIQLILLLTRGSIEHDPDTRATLAIRIREIMARFPDDSELNPIDDMLRQAWL